MADKQLFTAASNGFSAPSDAFVMREDADHPDLYVNELLFLSIIGGQAAVKAIASGILKKNTELVSLSANRYDDVEDGKRLYAAMPKARSAVPGNPGLCAFPKHGLGIASSIRRFWNSIGMNPIS